MLLVEGMIIAMKIGKHLEFSFHSKGSQHVSFRNMEIWDVEDLTNLNYEGKLVEYPDYQGWTYYGELIRINGDQCT